MLIAIPSKGRAGQTTSDRVLPSATLFVPANEADAYRATSRCDVVPVPQQVTGITRTRNWIPDTARDGRVVFVDDDVKKQGWMQVLPTVMRLQPMTEPQWLAEFAKLFDVALCIGYRIWGVRTEGSPRGTYPYRPFLWRTYVTASCMGILNDGTLRFDESYPVKEDYELCLRCLVEDGGVVGARFLVWENRHWADEGGCKEYRTQQMEADCIERLRQKYPGLVKRKGRGMEIALTL